MSWFLMSSYTLLLLYSSLVFVSLMGFGSSVSNFYLKIFPFKFSNMI